MQLAEANYVHPLFVVDELPRKKKIFIKNSFLKLGWQLGIQQRKFIKSIFRMISPEDKDFKTYRIKVKEFMDITGMDEKSVYKAVKEILETLWELRINVIQIDDKGNQGETEIQWLITKTYWPNLGIVDVSLHPQLKSYLLGIKKMKKGEGGFSVILPEELEGATCKHTERFYELLKTEWKNSKDDVEVEFTLDFLRYSMGFDKQPGIMASDAKYKLPADFKKRVLDDASREINGDRIFTLFKLKERPEGLIETVKTGKKITGFRAVITPRSQEDIRRFFIEELDYSFNEPLYEDMQLIDTIEKVSSGDELIETVNLFEPKINPDTFQNFAKRFARYQTTYDKVQEWAEKHDKENPDDNIFSKLNDPKYLAVVINEIEKIPEKNIRTTKYAIARSALLEGWGINKSKESLSNKDKETIPQEVIQSCAEVAATASFDLILDEYIQKLSPDAYRQLAYECQNYFLTSGRREEAKLFKPDNLENPVHAGILRSFIAEKKLGEFNC